MSEILNRLPTRRRFLTQASAAAAVACPICLGLGRAFASTEAAKKEAGHGGAVHWTYQGEGGPEEWGHLSAEFRVCELGQEQTPIDLVRGVGAGLSEVSPSFQDMALTILNNGHTIQANCVPGSGSTIEGRRFELLQFHFHHPSEHLLSGKPFAMELHFVHKSAEGQLAVLGVFIREGAENAALAPVFDAMPAQAGEPVSVGSTIAPASMLPSERGYFRYQGSLTTPPCSEGVLWTVFKTPVEASAGQIGRFAALFPVSNRPVQPLHRRFLLESL